MFAYKLLSLRRDNTLGSLFIDTHRVLSPGVWYVAGEYPTKGFAVRYGWHVMLLPEAPHLSKRGRVWANVEIDQVLDIVRRPKSQGGVWLTVKWIRILETK